MYRVCCTAHCSAQMQAKKHALGILTAGRFLDRLEENLGQLVDEAWTQQVSATSSHQLYLYPHAMIDHHLRRHP